MNAVLDGIGARSAWQGYRTLRPGGILVGFRVTGSVRNGKANDLAGGLGFLSPSVLNVLPDGKRAEFYGITMLYRKDPQPFREDLPKLFQLPLDKKIKPIIADILPLSAAARANEMLEKGQVQGKLVLRCSNE